MVILIGQLFNLLIEFLVSKFIISDSKLHGSEKCSGTDEDLFRERLKNMGKVSRRKFAQLTKVFTRTKKRGGRQLLPPTASCDDLLDPEDSRSQS